MLFQRLSCTFAFLFFSVFTNYVLYSQEVKREKKPLKGSLPSSKQNPNASFAQNHWFLLPTLIQSSRYSIVRKSNQRFILKIISRPVIDRKQLLQSAKIYEEQYLLWLQEQQKNLLLDLCNYQKKQKIKYIKLLEQEKERQYTLWKNVQKSYIYTLKSYLNQRLRKNKIEATLQQKIVKALNVISEIQIRRQRHWILAWESFLKITKSSLQELIVKKSMLTCDSKDSLLNQITTNPIIPKEESMRPYYLALYRFLHLLPLEERIRFLKKTHGI